MFKRILVIFACIACAAAKPGLLGAPLAYAHHAALVAAPAPVVTATSSQVVARTYNGIAAAPIVAPVAPVAPLARVPVAAPFAAPFAGSLAAAYSAPVVARYAAHAAPLAYSAPLAARYVASPYVAAAPLGYSHPLAAPLRYAAASPYLF